MSASRDPRTSRYTYTAKWATPDTPGFGGTITYTCSSLVLGVHVFKKQSENLDQFIEHASKEARDFFEEHGHSLSFLKFLRIVRKLTEPKTLYFYWSDTDDVLMKGGPPEFSFEFPCHIF